VRFSVDARHPDPVKAQRLYATHEAMMKEVASRRGLELAYGLRIDHEACLSDPGVVSALKRAAERQGVRTMVMASGAGHDTQQMALIAKTAMIFVRSKDGRSHTPEEFSSVEDIVDGIGVLAAGLHELAY
jgi:allantoate deiminase